MKTQISIFLAFLAFIITMAVFTGCRNNKKEQSITFYEVPLVCGAAPEIGCGSRIKPLFIETKKETKIKESWSNRQGTIIAIVWNGETSQEAQAKIIDPLYKKHQIDAKRITNKKMIANYTASMKKDQWYKEMDVDNLSLEEAGVIAEDVSKFALDAGLIDAKEKAAIKADLESYFKKELVIVRSCDELKSDETQGKWRIDGYKIYVKHIGRERADEIAAIFDGYDNMKKERCEQQGKESCCEKDYKGNESCTKK